MKKNYDHLYEIFESHLLEPLVDGETEEDFIAYVVEDYMSTLTKTAQLPLHYIEDVKKEAGSFVHDMMLKKTYGFFSLIEYQQSQPQKKKNSKN